MIPLIKTSLPPKDILMPRLEKILYSGYIAQGDSVEEFEKEFALHIGNKNCLSVNSGSSALHIALILAGVKPGDEVISTPMTAEPTNTVISQTGAKIIWADINPRTGNICPKSVKRKITSKTKAIMVVDYAGIPVDIDSFQAIEKQYKIPIIEDAAHALGASYNNIKIGNHFKYVIFSFQAIKHLTTIDGGMLCIKDEDEYAKGKLIRWFGIDKTKSRLENDIKVQGYKYHMNNVTATIGLVQLEYLDKIIESYIDNGNYFNNELKNIDDLELIEYQTNSQASYWLYTLKVKRRDEFIKMLNKNGISASELHRRNDTHTIFEKSTCTLNGVDQFCKEFVHIPCGWWVTEEDRNHIVNCIKSGW